MEDERIVGLFWERNEQALAESEAKYGAYCHAIARNILASREDAEECVNDTWLRAWNAMPPQRPAVLAAFLGKITRNLSFDRYRKLHREKRGGGEISLVLDELEECIPGGEDPEAQLQLKELTAEIARFLSTLSREKRTMFLLRYWYAESIAEIARRLAMSENNVSVSLNRIRTKLRDHLAKGGYDL